MRVFIILTITCLTSLATADVCWTKGPRPVVHQLKVDETLWFVSQLYYVQGAFYTRIMLANAITTPEDVQLGMFLYIPDPVHDPFKKNLSARYKELDKQRRHLLVKKWQRNAIAALAEFEAKPKPKRGVASVGKVQKDKNFVDPEEEGIKRLIKRVKGKFNF
jgi:hypothetical protein